MVVAVLLLLFGAIGVGSALSMDTSVPTLFGFGRVHNLGLIEQQRGLLMVACVTVLVGAILLAAGVVRSSRR